MGYRGVVLRGLVPGGKEFFEVVFTSQLLIVEAGRGVNLRSICGPVVVEFTECVGVGRHKDGHIFGGDDAAIITKDGERYVIVLAIEIVAVGNGRLTALDSYA